MSIADFKKVDGIGIKGEQLALLISDHLDWTSEYSHLIQLQKKINAYVSFIESEQYVELFPNYQFKSFLIDIHFKYELTPNCIKFIETVNKQLFENCITIQTSALN